MQTYWLIGATQTYLQNAILFESASEMIDSEVLAEFHPTMYEITEQPKPLTNVINKLPSTAAARCPFSGI